MWAPWYSFSSKKTFKKNLLLLPIMIFLQFCSTTLTWRPCIGLIYICICLILFSVLWATILCYERIFRIKSLNFTTPGINYLNTVGAGRGVSENWIIVIVLVKHILTALMFNYLINTLGKKIYCLLWLPDPKALWGVQGWTGLQSGPCPWLWPWHCSPLQVTPTTLFWHLNKKISEGQLFSAEKLKKTQTKPIITTIKPPKSLTQFVILATKTT